MNITHLPKLDKRIINWDTKKLIVRDCPICGKRSKPSFIRPDGLQVKECSKCGTFFVSPCPSNAQLSEFYSNYENRHRNAKHVTGAQLLKIFSKTNPNSDYRYQILTSLTDIRGKKLLDVGFGRGFFLYFFKKLGAHVTGIEIDDQTINYARNYLGVTDILKTDLLNLKKNNKFDIILFMDLFEHVLKPLEYFNKAKSLLNRNGLIAIFTPNASFAYEEAAPVFLRVDLEHMQYFSNATCNYLAKELELDIVHLENIGYPWLTNIVEDTSIKANLKNLIKAMPGFENAFQLWNKLTSQDLSRTGHYHLFCIFKKR